MIMHGNAKIKIEGVFIRMPCCTKDENSNYEIDSFIKLCNRTKYQYRKNNVLSKVCGISLSILSMYSVTFCGC